MKNNQGQEQYAPVAPSHGCQHSGNQYRAKCSVQEEMMIARVKMSGFLTGAGREVRDQPKAIQIGQDSRQGNESAVAEVVSGFFRDYPAGEQMRKRRHAKAQCSGPTSVTFPSKSAAKTWSDPSGSTVLTMPTPILCSHFVAPVFASRAKSRPFLVP